MAYVFLFFFFQAEDGIRDYKVTGVQTCALPIYPARRHGYEGYSFHSQYNLLAMAMLAIAYQRADETIEIGRASCRERVEISEVAGAVKKKRSRASTSEAAGCDQGIRKNERRARQ